MHEGNRGDQTERLFSALADYLRTPLLSIARSAELGREETDGKLLRQIENTADGAISLIDKYLLAQKVSLSNLRLELEPVAISSVLYDSAHELDSLAKAHHCSLVIDAHGRSTPVMAHRETLQAALTSLAHVFIEAAHPADKTNAVLTLASHGSKNGVVAGVFGNIEDLSNQVYRQAKSLYGKARVPLGDLSATSGVGVFVADSLLGVMSAHLRVARHANLNGLAATLVPSHQIRLI